MLLAAASTTILPAWVYATMPLWPLLGAALVGLMIALRAPRAVAHWPVVAGVGAAAVLGVLLFSDLSSARDTASAEPTAAMESPAAAQAEPAAAHAPARAAEHAPAREFHDPGFTFLVYNWLSFGQAQSLTNHQWIAANFYFDGLTGIMLLFVTFVSLMVVIYAVGYMRDHHGHPERGYERFFAFLGLFVFSMVMLVLAGNFVLLYLGWELVGLCSYLLIGFYYGRPEAAAAAKKAFIVNRIGDFGFALGIFALYMFVSPLASAGENPLDYAVAFQYAAHLETWQLTLVALLLMCGALGKSAQFPLYTWLPDAMEGPTPVSALIHAATMVTAGIYMVARCGPIFAHSPTALLTIVILGTIGAFLAASMAMAQYDMKRILAYSTISQLAYMFVGLGVGAPDSAVFHVFTHAWFKALLFLCAGSVMHAMGNVIDLRRFSGLGRILPSTRLLMLIGCLALAGFPLMSGFWSKDELIHAAMSWHPALGVILLVIAAMTAYYTFRMYFLCFHGPTRLPEEAGEHPHDAPAVMLAPLYVLAGGAILAGLYFGVTFAASGDAFLGFLKPHGAIHRYLGESTIVSAGHHAGGVWMMYLSAAIALGGIGLAWVRYGRAPQVDPDQQALGGLWNLWHAKYYLDEIYDRVFVRPLRALGEFCFATDRNGIDGLVWFVSSIPRGIGLALRGLQQGALQGYAASMVAGLAILVLLWRWLESSGH